MSAPEIQAFFDEPTNTVSYLVVDPATHKAAVVDPVLDYDHKSGKASTRSADAILKTAADRGLEIVSVLETHVHADHLSGAPYTKLKIGAKVAIGESIREVQKIFRPVFNADDVSGDGSEFDHLFSDGEIFEIGSLKGGGDRHARSHARLHLLQDRRCGVCRRYALHAGLRDGAGGFPRRRCAPALSFHSPIAEPA